MKRILMVCLGNICRSPLAEGILKNKLPDDYVVDSCGTIALHQGEFPDRRSIAVARKYGIDISIQRSRPIITDDFYNFDVIYCMDRNNYKDVLRLAPLPEMNNKVKLLLEEAKYPNRKDVPDPYWGTEQSFEEVYTLLDEACDTIASQLIQYNQY